MKRTALLVAAVALAMAGCSSSPGTSSPASGSPGAGESSNTGSPSGGGTSASTIADKDILIAWISPDATTSTRWDTQDRPAFEAAVQQLAPGAKVVKTTASTDAAMIQAGEAAITQGAQVIVINPITNDGSAPLVAEAHKAGVAVISYEGLIANQPVDGYITFDNLKVGELQAQYVVDHVAKGSTIALINGAQVCEACIDFKKGAHQVLDPLVQSGAIKLGYEQDTPDWLASNAQTETEQALTKVGNGLTGIVAANDGLAGGIIAALKAQNLNGKVVVTGQDATTAGLQSILLGDQTMTVYKDFHQQAQAAAKAAVALARGQKDQTSLTDTYDNGGTAIPALFLDPQVLDLSNIAMVFDNGFVTKAQICTGEVASHCDF